ncbi:uncharacterized protein [Asterias amurensis]|uniref:uncharacterized protein n=1 Tax=Asterias amurensis TaxID=7602 RepID=UPI003AB7D185
METSRNVDKFSKMERFLSGLSDFGKRSLNLSVLVNDEPLRKAYSTAMADGELPTNRARVLILGEPRAGKTSLLNRLLGREFDRNERPTHGIETRMCHVTNVDKQWNEAGSAKVDDIKECAAAIAALEEASSEEPHQKEDATKSFFKASPSSVDNFFSSASVETGLLNICKQFSIFFDISVVMLVSLFVGLSQFGYAAFTLGCIGLLTLVLDYNVAFRCAICVSVSFALFEAMARGNEHQKELSCTVNDDFVALDWFILQNIVFNVFNTAIFGTACGLGFRTGVAVAFSASVPPWEDSSGNTAWQSVSFWNAASICLVLLAGSLSGGVTYKYCTVNDRLHRRRTIASCFFMTLLFTVYVNVECGSRLLLYIFMNAYVMIVGMAWGFMFGRRAVMKHGFEARYITKKTIGLIFGFYLVRMCGWSLRLPGTSLKSLAFYTFSVIVFPLFDLYTAFRIWNTKSTFPVKTIRNQMKALIQGQPLLETKLSLWDFAGDTLYHCTHHVFMPDRAMYLIVFNLEAAVSDEEEQLQKLLFWLHSVCAHARHPDAVVMIVGTHKTSVPEAERKCFTDNLHNRIASKFCDRLVLNPADDKPLFLVENSDAFDRDFRQLRAEIFRRVETAEYAQEKYPIKYLHFYREIQNRRKLAQAPDCDKNVASLQEIQDLANLTCNIEGEEQLQKMLRYFNEAGEIIYREEDVILRQHVVLDPQFLVDVMKKLVDIPRAYHRSHRYAIEWRNYENTGIISEELLHHIYFDMPHLIPLLINLLQAFDLIGSLEPNRGPSYSHPSFLVPAMLPPFECEGSKFWESQDKEEVFYFDFGFFDPTTIYYRLLARCLSHANRENDEPHFKPLIFADRSRFYIGTSLIFKLQLEKRSSQQQLLSVAILTFDSENSSQELLGFLVEAVTNITARDYSHLNFTFGPRCPFCETPRPSNELTDVTEHDEAIHVLKMAGNDKSFPTRSSTVMFCGVRRHSMKLSKSRTENLPSTSHPPQRVVFGPETLITKIPPDLFDKVCCFLNTRGQRSWKTLAGELGKDVDFVAALDSEGVTNPSEHLLKGWSMEGGVTVADLLEVLERPGLERKDIIQEVKAQMS